MVHEDENGRICTVWKETMFSVEEETEGVISHLSRSSFEPARTKHRVEIKVRFHCYSNSPHFPSDFSKAGHQGRMDMKVSREVI